MKIRNLSILLLILCLGTGLANAGKKTISIASFVNNSWCGQPAFMGCTTFPYGTKHYDGMTYALLGNKKGRLTPPGLRRMQPGKAAERFRSPFRSMWPRSKPFTPS